jgi:hypothetical protein
MANTVFLTKLEATVANFQLQLTMNNSADLLKIKAVDEIQYKDVIISELRNLLDNNKLSGCDIDKDTNVVSITTMTATGTSIISLIELGSIAGASDLYKTITAMVLSARKRGTC